jgi:hypothetical protein
MIILNDKTLQIDNSFFPFLTRWYKGDDRRRIVDFIDYNLKKIMEHVEMIFSDIENHRNNNNKIALEECYTKLQEISRDLIGAADGFKSMKQTYHADTALISHIDLLDQNRNLYVSRIIKRCTEEFTNSKK